MSTNLPTPEPKLAYRKEDAAKLLSIGRSTLWRHIARGEIKTTIYGRVPHSELEKFIQKRTA